MGHYGATSLTASMVELVSDFGPGGGGQASTGILHWNSMVWILGSFPLRAGIKFACP